ncbi:uncharacterized protein LAESUDRAFT_721861 [Laetiporus sulphureus 93-53]|uniref:Uncharacterized protein n=1 Tax=Laetiporus sulphureus 93-53 TaxID=1314785 RepID=A0A165GKZ1_9APHY|nr:uncharacterized protein LAESUDRAFT_721861 [Laetiporus sulphureus 93-53]KZT10494.1 hypothetical protein LAESUDRAFT_721861 [Laetiporus sulphureus 93-53]
MLERSGFLALGNSDIAATTQSGYLSASSTEATSGAHSSETGAIVSTSASGPTSMGSA